VSDQQLFREALKAGSDCPRIEELEKLLDGRVPNELLQRHVNQCGHCRTELAMLRSFHSDDVPDSDSAAVRKIAERLAANSSRRPEPWWQWFTAAWVRPAALAVAGLMIVAGIAIQLRQNGAPPLNPIPDGGRQVFRSSTIAAVSPSGDVSEAPSQMAWEGVTGAVHYQVRLLEVDRTELWKADVTGTSAGIPAEIRARIVPLKTLLWEVTGFDSAGAKIGQSETVRFRFSQNLHNP
jgi:hypothetical protein